MAVSRRRRAYRPTRQEPPFKLENPEAFPAWVYGRSLGDADTLRGGPVFDALAEHKLPDLSSETRESRRRAGIDDEDDDP